MPEASTATANTATTPTKLQHTPTLPNGLVAFVKHNCPTCQLVSPVLGALAEQSDIVVYTQSDAEFPSDVPASNRYFDSDLSVSWHHDIEVVPTLVTVTDGVETERTVGWNQDEWRRMTGIANLGADLPKLRPG